METIRFLLKLFMRETVVVDVGRRRPEVVYRLSFTEKTLYNRNYISYNTTANTHTHTCCCCLKVFWVIGAFLLLLLLLPPMFLYRSMTIIKYTNGERERERKRRPATIRPWSLFINHKRKRENRRRLAWKRWAVTVCVCVCLKRSTMTTNAAHGRFWGGQFIRR